MTISERIVYLIDDVLHVTKKKAAEEMKASYTTIQNITNGKTTHPKSDLLANWKKARPDLNMNWLLGGEGQPLLSMTPAPAADVEALPRDTEVLQIKLQAADEVIESLKSQVATQADVIRLMKENHALQK